MNRITEEVATAKAKNVSNEIKNTKVLIAELKKVIPMLEKFDGKVYTQRMFNAFMKETKLRFYESGISEGASVSYYDTDTRSTVKHTLHWGFTNSFSGELKEVQVYNPDAKNLSGRTHLVENSTGKLRIVAEGWKELFEGVILCEENTIKNRKAFTNSDKVKKAFDKYDELEIKIRELKDKQYNALPSYLK